ncbi:hypothetical protein TWF730_004305 [Orbilia blumenaviensis]|uniref:JmjC domain-containing protein n=1 Tax=Orbilia blumenaviensis TaxID=1796055 RepID=A0AAV9U0A9_9PEZI
MRRFTRLTIKHHHRRRLCLRQLDSRPHHSTITTFSHPAKPFQTHPTPSTFAQTWTDPQSRTPTKFPSPTFTPHIPALTTWFLPPNHPNQLNIPYLLSLASSSTSQVPLELTLPNGETDVTCLPFTAFLGYLSAPSIHPSAPRLYLAQHPPPDYLSNDLPSPFPHLGFQIRSSRTTTQTSQTSQTDENKNNSKNKPPEIDIYTTSLWLSRSSHQTHTPLHRDPNDNIFLQLSSSKIIRVIPPKLGDLVFKTLHSAGRLSSTDPTGRIRDGLLTGKESGVMDRVIWGDYHHNHHNQPEEEWEEEGEEEGEEDIESQISAHISASGEVYQTVVEKGEAVYIPAGWWHSVKSVLPEDVEEMESKGVTTVVGSMNWWFR